jgi:hypothetical protein
MEDLIKALQIFVKYGNSKWPTYCEHDELNVVDIEKDKVSDEDIKTLEELGFFWSDGDNCFKSYRFGSA